MAFAQFKMYRKKARKKKRKKKQKEVEPAIMFKYYNPLMDIIDTIFINIEPFLFFCHFILFFL